MEAQKQLRNQAKGASIVPYQQGEFDALCGVYATINALHWVCYDHKRLSKYRAGFLMESSFDQLARKRLLNNVILHGMGNRTWRGIIRNSVTAMKERYGLDIDYVDIKQSSTLDATLKNCLDSEQVLLTHIKGVYNHYTVIVGYTECNWVLFDSDGFKYVRQKSVKASFERKRPRHSFAKNGIIAMSFIFQI